jgi:HAE1 family hydrophobic/amphiphilic exporter-1
MSLLGLSLVVGILVDDAIVVLENIYRHMEMGKTVVPLMKELPKLVEQ